jgi:phage terminase large subunit GpA-like protein
MLMQRVEALPPFETGAQLFARQAHLYRPKERLTVSQWADRYNPNYDPMALPYLAEIMDALGDPETVEVGDMGPAQAGKSEVGLNWMGWTIDRSADPFLVVQPDKAATETFVKLRVNELVRSVPVLQSALLPDSSADNMHLKLFKGMYVGAAWPVKSQLRQRPYCNVWADDFDAMPEDIEGEGGLLGLLGGRQTTFEGRETKLVSSSPGLEGGGIEAFVEGGTDERLQPRCPSCGDRWEIDMRRDLHFDRKVDGRPATPDEAASSVHVVCGTNGCILDADARFALLRSCADLPNRGFVARNRDASKYRRTFRRDGLMAFTSWTKLARDWREAEIAWEERQDESLLRSFWNVKGGKNYRSQLSGERPIESKDLLRRREAGWRVGTAPRGPKVLLAQVDVQHDRFEVAVLGFAAGRETWVIDRFAITVLDDGITGVQPFVHKEHWKALLPLFDRKVPMVEGALVNIDRGEVIEPGRIVGHAPIMGVAVDTGGSDKSGDQATEGAKFFFAAAVSLGVHERRITLLKGGSKITAPLMPAGQFADQKIKGGAKRRSARLWIPNVHRIKNIIDARLRRTAPGPGYIHLPGDIGLEYIEEIASEELVDGKWKKRRTRNETWDHLVYGEATLLRPGYAQSSVDMRWIWRGFSVLWPKGGSAEPEPQPGSTRVPTETKTENDQPPPVPAPRRRKVPVRRGKGWMGRLS